MASHENQLETLSKEQRRRELIRRLNEVLDRVEALCDRLSTLVPEGSGPERRPAQR